MNALEVAAYFVSTVGVVSLLVDGWNLWKERDR